MTNNVYNQRTSLLKKRFFCIRSLTFKKAINSYWLVGLGKDIVYGSFKVNFGNDCTHILAWM